MSDHIHVEIKDQFPFFEIFSKEEKETIAASSSNIIKFQSGANIITQGEKTIQY